MNTLFTLATQDFLRKLWFGVSSGASTQAQDTEDLFLFILWVNIISFVLLMIIMVYFVVRYRRSRQAQEYKVSAAHNTPLELAWSIIPLLIMVPIFYWGFEGYVGKLAAPSDAEDVYVRGQKWQWSFKYKNGAEPQGDLVEINKTKRGVAEFVVPAGRPVRLVMTSADVIHAFYVPDFRTKMDVIPNRYTSMWFQANQPGTHTVFCAEYCGQDHSEMAAQVRVVTPQEYMRLMTDWLKASGTTNPIEFGKKTWQAKGCSSCHTVDGAKGTGPTWKDMYGERHNYTNGEKDKLVDENWLRENILYSQKRILVGPDGPFPPSMPNFAGQLSDEEVEALIFYIKSLSPTHVKPEDLEPGKKTYNEIRSQKK